MISVFGGRTPVFLLAMLSMMLIAGGLVGANTAADGGERIDIAERLNDEMFTDGGELKAQERAVETPQTRAADRVAELVPIDSPESPRLDAALQRYLIVPMIKGAVWLSVVGYQLGYAMTATVGVGVSRVVFNGALVAVFGGVAWYVVSSVRDISEVGA
jgi:hypothetical protein